VKHEEISPICFIGSSELRHEPKGVMLIIAPCVSYPPDTVIHAGRMPTVALIRRVALLIRFAIASAC
jgi:hypothetical protein